MYYNFQTDEKGKAVAALLVYSIYRSRDKSKFNVTPDMWGRIERAVKSVAKRSRSLDEFIENLKPKLHCSSIQPRWAETIQDDLVSMKKSDNGELIQVEDEGKRQFLVDVIAEINDQEVLEVLYKKAAVTVLLVRDRIEREKEYKEAN